MQHHFVTIFLDSSPDLCRELFQVILLVLHSRCLFVWQDS